MKLGELCRVMNLNLSMQISYQDNDDGKVTFWINGKSSQKLERCGVYASWNVAEISKDNSSSSYIDVEIVKPEDDDE